MKPFFFLLLAGIVAGSALTFGGATLYHSHGWAAAERAAGISDLTWAPLGISAQLSVVVVGLVALAAVVGMVVLLRLEALQERLHQLEHHRYHRYLDRVTD